jgi:hypothetical protein
MKTLTSFELVTTRAVVTLYPLLYRAARIVLAMLLRLQNPLCSPKGDEAAFCWGMGDLIFYILVFSAT